MPAWSCPTHPQGHPFLMLPWVKQEVGPGGSFQVPPHQPPAPEV